MFNTCLAEFTLQKPWVEVCALRMNIVNKVVLNHRHVINKCGLQPTEEKERGERTLGWLKLF